METDRDNLNILNVVILAGGSGTRFWPLSRDGHPKQFLALTDDEPMLAATYRRISGFVPPERVRVVTQRDQEAEVRRLLAKIPPENILVEPVGRNTAAAVLWATLEVFRADPDAILAVLPSDHRIGDLGAFVATLFAAANAANTHGAIVTLGIPPQVPETGYGYIEAGELLGDGPARAVVHFHEKPDYDTAASYVASGHHSWNAGMFFFRADVCLAEAERTCPDILDALKSGPPDAVYPAIRAESFDRAVLELTDRAAVVPSPGLGWSDVGSFSALYDLRPAGALSYTKGDVLELNGEGNVIINDTPGHTLAVCCVADVVVVSTPEGTLVIPREQAQDVRAVVEALRARHGKT